jgi:CRP/FNR family transcriptional regulator, polysaccharide utilization system transcription regulator
MSPDLMRARLSQEFEQALGSLMTERTFPRGVMLYSYGVLAEGLYLINSGSVRVLLPASDNQNQLLEMAREDAILGLSETLSGEHYRVSVQADEETNASFVARNDFVELLNSNQEFSMEVVRMLSDSLHGLYHRFRSVSAHPGRPRRRVLNEGLS